MSGLAVHCWPGPVPAPQDGLLVLLCDTAGQRPAGAGRQRQAARGTVRLAVRTTLAALLGLQLDDIGIDTVPGAAPRVTVAGRPSTIGCSFSHEGTHALAAINLHGPVGVDFMHMQDIPDWQAVATDYLGPAVAAALGGLPDAERASAFIRAWTRREAALKCTGQQLSEWQADIPGQTIALDLPIPGLQGHLHIGDKLA